MSDYVNYRERERERPFGGKKSGATRREDDDERSEERVEQPSQKGLMSRRHFLLFFSLLSMDAFCQVARASTTAYCCKVGGKMGVGRKSCIEEEEEEEQYRRMVEGKGKKKKKELQQYIQRTV